MRFLVDAQLPPALARQLVASGHDATHVSEIGLLTASDREIWRYAAESRVALITKDEDFVTMRALRSEGPAIIWVRLGNTNKRQLLSRFVEVLPSIISALERNETVIEISTL